MGCAEVESRVNLQASRAGAGMTMTGVARKFLGWLLYLDKIRGVAYTAWRGLTCQEARGASPIFCQELEQTGNELFPLMGALVLLYNTIISSG